MSATSLQGLVEMVAARENCMSEHTTTSLGTTTTAISTAFWQDDNYYEGANLYVKEPTTIATVTATISGGAVNGLVLGNAGAGYCAVPTLVFSGGGGAGAACTPTISGGVLTGFGAITGGSGYTSAPTVTVVHSAPQGQERQVRLSTDSTDTLTFSYAMTAAVPNSATVQLYTRWSRSDIVRALNNAVANAHEWHRRVVDESLTTLVSTYSYSLASLTNPVTSRWGINRVSIQWDTSLSTYPYMTWYDWNLRENEGTQTLQFSVEPPVGRLIRIEYLANAKTMSASTDTCGVDSSTGIDDFLVEWALSTLWQQQTYRSPQNAQLIMQMAKSHRDEAERIRRTAGMHDRSRKIQAPFKRHTEVGSEYAAFNFTPTS